MASKQWYMKNYLFPILILGTILALSSCNNGDYLADPQGNIPRPPSLQGAEEGVIDGYFDSSYKRFTTGTWTQHEGLLIISGTATVNKQPVATITLSVWDYKGPGSYQISSDTMVGNSITYGTVGYEDSAAQVFLAKDGFGYGTIIITEEGSSYKGEYHGRLQYVNMDEPEVPGHDSITIYDGRFNVTKLPE